MNDFTRERGRPAGEFTSTPDAGQTPALPGFPFRRLDRVSDAGAGEQKRKVKHMTLTPVLAELTGNFHVGLAALGAAMGVGFIGMKASEAVGRNPGAATAILVQSILAIAFAEAIVFYALFLAK
jgi:F-type H+-transporting ATPase subunit c